jgi:tetratricopeptide (TPR) repeat protein
MSPLAEAARQALQQDLQGPQPPIRWARARLLTAINDPSANAELRAVATTPPPLGPTAALALAERTLATAPAEALEATRPWLTPDSLSDPDIPAARLAGLALSAADTLGDAPAALRALQVLAALAPEDTTLGGLLAERLAAAGDAPAAASELSRLAALEESHANPEAAASLYSAAIGLSPSDPAIIQRSADLARRRGDREEARRLLLQLADLDSDHRLAALLAAADLSPWGPRVDVLRRAIEAAPADPEPRRRLVGALVNGGQAVQAAAEAAALAELLQQAGDRAGALAAIEHARRLDPWNPGLQALREALAAGHEGQ